MISDEEDRLRRRVARLERELDWWSDRARALDRALRKFSYLPGVLDAIRRVWSDKLGDALRRGDGS